MPRICIVEDDRHISQMIEATLTMMDYECVCCTDGKEAVERILSEPFDLILLDIMLPELDGFGVLEKVKSRGIPVIFLTAMGSVTDKVKGLRLGAGRLILSNPLRLWNCWRALRSCCGAITRNSRPLCGMMKSKWTSSAILS